MHPELQDTIQRSTKYRPPLFYCESEITSGRLVDSAHSGLWKEFVALNLRGHTCASIIWLNAHNRSGAVNVNVCGKRELFRKGKHELDLRADFHAVIGREIKSAKTHVSRFGLQFAVLRSRFAKRNRQRHRKPPRIPALSSSFQSVPQKAIYAPHASIEAFNSQLESCAASTRMV